MIFPLAAGILTLLLPFAKIPIKLPAVILPVALNVVANTPVVNVLPERVLAREVNVTTSFVIETFEPNAISALLTSQPINAIFAAVS